MFFQFDDPVASTLYGFASGGSITGRPTGREGDRSLLRRGMTCIWCLKPITKPSLEHGIPEALGCPPDLLLPDVACAPCNNQLGTIDQALLKQFEAITVMYGVPRKKGRRPTIDSWRSLSSKNKADGPHMFLNAGPGVIEAGGKKLHPAAKSNGIHDVWMDQESGSLGFKQEFGNDPRFVPALYKIGLNLVARHFGPEVAAGAEYDHVRVFVRGGVVGPKLRVMMTTEVIPAAVTRASNPIVKPGRPMPLFQVTILGVTFVLDMSLEQEGLIDLHGAATLHGNAVIVLPPL